MLLRISCIFLAWFLSASFLRLPLIWFDFLKPHVLFTSLWMLCLIKCWQLRDNWWLHRNLERNQLLIDLLVGASSCTDFFFFWLTFLWFLVHMGNEGEQDNIAFLQLCSLCSGASKHYFNVNWNISYWHMLHSCIILQYQA